MTDRSNPISLAQIHSYLWGAATILRGLIGAGDYKQFIFPLVFYKRLSDIWDEDYTNALATYAGNADLAKAEADERFVIPAGAHWNDTRTVAKDVGKALQDAMRTIEAANPGSFGGIFGDALEAPRFTEADRLRIFDVVLANPPYSIKRWNRDAWSSDPWGHNALGTPPQGRADFAFFQHILASLDPHTGRCAIRFPHGVLFRNEEAEMRRKLIESDRLDCVLGLGPNLFFNSPMEACVVVCRARKPPER